MASTRIAEQPALARPRGWSGLSVPLGTLACSALLALVLLLVAYPLVLLLAQSFEVGAFGTPTRFGFDNWVAAVTQADLVASLVNTVTLALARQVIALAAAIFLAWLIARTDLPARNWLEFGFWVCVFLPNLTVTLGWIMVFDGHNGVANQLLQKLPFVSGPVFDIYSWWGIVGAHLLSGTIAVKVMLLTPAFRNLDAALEEASLTSGAGKLGTLVRVVIPILAPAILVVTVLSTIRALESFEIELILGAPVQIDVFSTKIYRIAQREPPQYGVATALSMAVLTIMLPFIVLQQWWVGRRSFATVSGKFTGSVQRLGPWRWPAFALVFGLVFVMTILPVLLVITGTFMTLFGYFTIATPWTLRHWQTVLGSADFLRSVQNTLVLAFGKAFLAMGWFTLMAYIIVRTKFAARGALDLLVWIPSTLPGIVLGLGYLWLFLGTPILRPLYGTTWILILVATLGSITLGTQIIKSTLIQIGAELEEASWTSGASWWYTLRRVVLPLIAPAIAVVGVLGFSAAARTTGPIALLSSHNNQPLSMLQLGLMAENQYGAASVVGVFLLLLTVGVAIIARAFGLRFGTGSR